MKQVILINTIRGGCFVKDGANQTRSTRRPNLQVLVCSSDLLYLLPLPFTLDDDEKTEVDDDGGAGKTEGEEMMMNADAPLTSNQ
jgi:hypothetical protein